MITIILQQAVDISWSRCRALPTLLPMPKIWFSNIGPGSFGTLEDSWGIDSTGYMSNFRRGAGYNSAVFTDWPAYFDIGLYWINVLG
ncbi:hypothetical protein FQN50_006922 [Emmonsiellopsis sp. PD_5]|nr:hypothetical protein FQN50_006922 [Emmonsiellopsis sp. PD_5]